MFNFWMVGRFTIYYTTLAQNWTNLGIISATKD